MLFNLEVLGNWGSLITNGEDLTYVVHLVGWSFVDIFTGVAFFI